MEQKKFDDPFYKSFQRFNFFLEESLFYRFQKIAGDQNISFSRLGAQFIKNYVYFLEDEFLDSDEHVSRNEGTKAVTIYLPSEIFIKYKEKTQNAKISLSQFVREMVARYVEFVEKQG